MGTVGKEQSSVRDGAGELKMPMREPGRDAQVGGGPGVPSSEEWSGVEKGRAP